SWKQHVLNEIDRDSVLLVLIGKDWSNARDTGGNRRLDKPDDPIRLEIADAMHDGAAIIPLLLENAQMPAASELPQELIPLAELNALKLRDGDWEADVTKIVQRLEKLGAKRIAGTDPLSVTTKRSAKAIWSLVIVALIAIGFLGEDQDRETLGGFLVLSLVALALAGFAYFDIKQRRASGKGLAIGGLVASALTALVALGTLMEAPQPVARIDSPAPESNPPPPSAAPPEQTPAPAPAQSSPQPAAANAPAVPTQALAPAAPPKPAPSPAPAATKAPPQASVNVAGQWHDEEEGTLVVFTQDGGNVHFVATEAGLAVEGRGTISGPDIAMTLYMANVAIGQSSMRVSTDGRRIQGRMNVNGDVSDFAFIR
ncbi:MAG: hypothetical protein ACREV9_12510, partial [Burkholderiales bacterium]